MAPNLVTLLWRKMLGNLIGTLTAYRHSLEAIMGETAQALPEVIGDVGVRPLTDVYSSSDVKSVTVIVLGSSQHQGILEIGDELGIEVDLLRVQGLKKLAVQRKRWKGIHSMPVAS